MYCFSKKRPSIKSNLNQEGNGELRFKCTIVMIYADCCYDFRSLNAEFTPIEENYFHNKEF